MFYSLTDRNCSTARVSDDALKGYDEAKEKGSTVNLVFHSKVRDFYRFTVNVYTLALKKMTIVLKFEQLLSADNDTYSWAFNLYTVDQLEELEMNVRIEEEGKVRNILPAVQHVNDVTKRRLIGKILSVLLTDSHRYDY